MTLNRERQNCLSAVWAAYGDALGFITELADDDRVQYRAGASNVSRTIEWRRRVGGWSGGSILLPAGTYSDDTQLRLSTSRAIRADGTFDVAAFAKVELPAWANYALGAGTGSREAAANLARTSATWYSNFYKNKRASYIQGGGNGAAMRIQPHVWSAPDLKNIDLILRDVVKNSICTHGHPTGILGACFHAATLATALQNRSPPSMERCIEIALSLHLPEVIGADGDLRLLWAGQWVGQIGESVEVAFAAVVNELVADLRSLNDIREDDFAKAYDFAIKRLDARKPEARGSATKTSALAAFIAARCDLARPFDTLELVANALGSDTDSIGTMAGAIIGACSLVECNAPVQDRLYIESEAARLAAVSKGEPASSFRYPDLRSWKPAKTAIDAVASTNDHLVLDGIGPLKPKSDPLVTKEGSELLWLELDFGQTILAHVREAPRQLSSNQRSRSPTRSLGESLAATPRLPNLFAGKVDRHSSETAAQEASTLNDTLLEVIKSGFNPELIGRALLAQVQPGRPNFVERGIALASTILTAYEARSRQRK